VRIQRGFTDAAPGSVLVEFGRTRVLCTASVEDGLPRWREPSGLGWVTAEYAMLPASTAPRKRREFGKRDGRSVEIGRLIGRSLRAVVDFEALGPRSVWLDCDVLVADGGTRTAAITGAYVALADACRVVGASAALEAAVAAVSVGIVDGACVLDLPYSEDASAAVDMNVVMTSEGRLVEVQGSAEAGTFTREQHDALLDLAAGGVERLVELQHEALAGPGGGV
jgi:ribonuclease PH